MAARALSKKCQRDVCISSLLRLFVTKVMNLCSNSRVCGSLASISSYVSHVNQLGCVLSYCLLRKLQNANSLAFA